MIWCTSAFGRRQLAGSQLQRIQEKFSNIQNYARYELNKWDAFCCCFQIKSGIAADNMPMAPRTPHKSKVAIAPIPNPAMTIQTVDSALT